MAFGLGEVQDAAQPIEELLRRLTPIMPDSHQRRRDRRLVNFGDATLHQAPEMTLEQSGRVPRGMTVYAAPPSGRLLGDPGIKRLRQKRNCDPLPTLRNGVPALANDAPRLQC
jgi:hypothetical protein